MLEIHHLKSIVILGGATGQLETFANFIISERRQGYHDALTKHHIAIQEKLMIPVPRDYNKAQALETLINRSKIQRVELVRHQIAKNPVTETIKIKPELAINKSCGCSLKPIDGLKPESPQLHVMNK